MVTTTCNENDAPKYASLSRHFLGEENDAENDAFKFRLKEVIGTESTRAFALRAGISPTAVRQYLAGKSLPTLDSLIAVAKTGNVNLLWLATGEGQKTGKPITYEFNQSTLARSLELVDKVGSGLPVERRARLASAIYSLYIRSGEAVDDALVEEIVRQALGDLSQTM